MLVDADLLSLSPAGVNWSGDWANAAVVNAATDNSRLVVLILAKISFLEVDDLKL